MLRTLDYGDLVVVEASVIRRPYDEWIDSVKDSDGNWYNIYALAEDSSLVAVLDETLED